VLSIPLMAANPCSLGLVANIGLRVINGMQLIGNGINAVQNIMAGNYLSAGMDILGMLGNLSKLTSACFTGDTKLYARGQWGLGWRRIDQLTPMDEVLSRDENSLDGALEWKRIEETFILSSMTLHLHVRGQVIKTTAAHPFWVYNRGWVEAAQLRTGDLLSARDGQWVAVEELFHTGEFVPVYNVRVADFHTYFVGDDDWGFDLWAHNAKCIRIAGKTEADNFKKTGGFSGRPGHPNNPLRVSVPAEKSKLIKNLRQTRKGKQNYTHLIEVEIDDAKLAAFKKKHNIQPVPGHNPNSMAIPQEHIEEFNSLIQSSSVTVL
jgi:Pretoxin HINT domain